MSTIQQDIQAIRQATYGREVREAIADGIEKCYEDVSSAKTIADDAAEDAQYWAGKAEEAHDLAMSAAGEATSAAETGVRSDTYNQGLTDAQKRNARFNIDSADETDVLIATNRLENTNAERFWVLGRISDSTGNVINNTTTIQRITTTPHLPIDQIARIRALPGYGWRVALYASYSSFLGMYPSGWCDGGEADVSQFLEEQPTAVYFRLTLRKSDDSAISLDDWSNAEILRNTPEVPDPDEWEEISIFPLAQGRYKADTTGYAIDDSYHDYRVSAESVTAIPYGGETEVRWILPPWVIVNWRCGTHANDLHKAYDWHGQSNEPITVGLPHYLYWRPVFASWAGNQNSAAHNVYPISVNDLKGVRLFVRRSPSISEADPDALRILDSVRRHGMAVNAPALPVIAHASDVHGDQYRAERFAKFADEAKADVMVVSGDICARTPPQGAGFLHEIIRKHSTPAMLCVGNHDMSGAASNMDIYNGLIAPVAEELAYNRVDSMPWYYRDIGDLRLISMNTFEPGATTSERNHMSSDQLQWLADTLYDSDGKYILIVQHSPFMSATAATAAEGYETFFGSQRVSADLSTEFTDGKPVYDIVDAFISRSSLNRTWTQGGTVTSINASKNFSECTGEFVAHIVGHVHCDLVTYAPSVQKQLLLGVTCGTSVWGPETYSYIANCDDMGRVSGSTSQDAVNLYAIDTENGTVTIVRAGQRWTRDGNERRVMTIPYKE